MTDDPQFAPLSERIRELAVNAVCPINRDPRTVFEINMVKTLEEFGQQVAALLSETAAPARPLSEDRIVEIAHAVERTTADDPFPNVSIACAKAIRQAMRESETSAPCVVAPTLEDLEKRLAAAKFEKQAFTDALRYRFLRDGVFAHRVEHGGRNDYMLAVNIPQREQTNIMRGSIAGHMDDEIDAAMKRDGDKEQGSTDDLPGMLALAKGVAEQRWPHTVDAQKWAREFLDHWKNEKVGSVNLDEGALIGWFANAIMAGYDTAQSRAALPSTEPKIKYERAPELDCRIANGDDFAGDAWVRYTAVGQRPEDSQSDVSPLSHTAPKLAESKIKEIADEFREPRMVEAGIRAALDALASPPSAIGTTITLPRQLPPKLLEAMGAMDGREVREKEVFPYQRYQDYFDALCAAADDNTDGRKG